MAVFYLRWVMVTKKQLEALEKNRAYFKRTTREQQRKISSAGGKASQKKQAEKKSMKQLVDILLNAPVLDDDIKEKLEAHGLPTTIGGKTLLEAIDKAGSNSNMLRVILELAGEIKQNQTSVTVNNNPYADLSDETLKKMAEEE